MREWLLLLVLAVATWVMSSIPARALNLPMEIFFICQTASAATDVAYNIGDGVPGIAELPSGCEWLHGEVMEKRMAHIEEVVNVINLADGRIVYVARVSRDFFPGGYSAGYLDGMS